MDEKQRQWINTILSASDEDVARALDTRVPYHDGKRAYYEWVAEVDEAGAALTPRKHGLSQHMERTYRALGYEEVDEEGER